MISRDTSDGDADMFDDIVDEMFSALEGCCTARDVAKDEIVKNPFEGEEEPSP
jgi:hypothetical protein